MYEDNKIIKYSAFVTGGAIGLMFAVMLSRFLDKKFPIK